MLDVNTCYYICKNLCSNGDITSDEVVSVAFDMFANADIFRCSTEECFVDMFTAKLAEFTKEKENHKNNNVVNIRGL